MLFWYHDNVVNTFISEKKSKNGKRFEFVRFFSFLDAQKAIIRLNRFVIPGNKIWVKIARFKSRREIWKKVNSQKNTLIRKEKNQDGTVGENKKKETKG